MRIGGLAADVDDSVSDTFPGASKQHPFESPVGESDHAVSRTKAGGKSQPLTKGQAERERT